MYPNCTLRLKNSHTILGVANQLLQEAYHSHDLVTIRCTHTYMLWQYKTPYTDWYMGSLFSISNLYAYNLLVVEYHLM